MNSSAFHKLSYGLYVISTLDGERPTGCIANSVLQITSDPASVAVSLNHNNYTNSCIDKSGKFAISVLHEQSDPGIISTFGFQSGKDNDKFKAVNHHMVEGLPVIDDACAYIICQVINKMETETHTIFLGRVLDADVLKNETSMTYAYYHSNVKGKGNAPAKPSAGGATYVCSVCGYVYDGDTPFEELPEDWKCPLCKQPKSVFKKTE